MKNSEHARQELAENEARLNAILRTAVDGIITIDEQGIVQSLNPAAEKIFGYTREELLGQNIAMLMTPPDRDEHDAYITNYLRTGKHKIIGTGREVVGLRKDGATFPMDLAVSEVPLGDRRCFTGIVRDVTDRKRAEAEQACLGRIVEESLNELCFFNAETLKFVQVNRGARENLGFDMDELRQMTPVDIEPEFTPAQFRKLIEPLVNGDTAQVVFETLHERKDGSTYDVEVHLQMGQYRDQRVCVAIVLDVTSRKEAERQLNRINEELEQRVADRTRELQEAQEELMQKERLATIGRVSGGIAHEIRNPLNALKTSVYYLLHANHPSAEKTREHLERIDRQVTLANNVITTLADFARLPTPKLQPMDLSVCLDEAVNTISIPANIRVEVRMAAPIPPVLADENQLGIAFRNLIRNARDAMPNGGTIQINVQQRGDEIEIDVVDHGVGILDDHLQRIMEPLFTTKARGIGLGLAIANSIVEKNQGRLRVASEVGEGSTFTVGATNGGPRLKLDT